MANSSTMDDMSPCQHYGQRREVVLQVEAADERGVGVGQLPEELVVALLPEGPAGHGVAHDVVGEGAEQVAQV